MLEVYWEEEGGGVLHGWVISPRNCIHPLVLLVRRDIMNTDVDEKPQGIHLITVGCFFTSQSCSLRYISSTPATATATTRSENPSTHIIGNRTDDASLRRTIAGIVYFARIRRRRVLRINEVVAVAELSSRLIPVAVGPGRDVAHVCWGGVIQVELDLLDRMRKEV